MRGGTTGGLARLSGSRWRIVPCLAVLMLVVHGQARGQERGDRGGERGGGGRRQDRQGPDGRGRGGGQMPPFARMRTPQAAAPSMAVSGGKLYIVIGRELKSLDAETLEEQAKAEVPAPPEIEERMGKIKEAMLKKLDKDGDGFITREESPRPELVERFDKDGDGKVAGDELQPPAMMMRPAGPATLLVEAPSVYVFQDGWLFRFDAEKLTLQAKAELAPQQRGMQGRGGPPGDRGRGRGGDWGRGPGQGPGNDRPWNRPTRRDGRGDQPPPKVPDDPVAF